MKQFCDLHSHSTFSDGTNTPEELVSLAEEKGLSALALTDHNTSGGLKRFMEAGKKSRVITIPGCEFSTEWNGKEIHVVGLFFKEKYWPEIDDFLELAHIAKVNSNTRLIDLLAADGYDITFEEVSALSGGKDFNRSHVARVLVQKGVVQNVPEAFAGLLKEGNGYYFPPKRITSIAAVRFIKTFGATAIIAHPLLNLNEEELRVFLPEAKAAGLDAIETEILGIQSEALELHKAKQRLEVGAAEYEARKKELQEMMKTKESERAALESSTLKYAEVRAWLKAFDEGINSGKLLTATDCEIMRMIVDRIIVKDNGIEVCLKCGVSIGQEFIR